GKMSITGNRLIQSVNYSLAGMILLAAILSAAAQAPPGKTPKKTSVSAPAQSTDEQTEQRLRWWREARFGMFIHWGLYADPAGEWKLNPIPGIGEWIMSLEKIVGAEDEQLAAHFNPVRFNAEEG